MAKLSLTNITSGYQSFNTYNNNNDLIEEALKNTLSRDGTSPNQMESQLDMNSNRIVNLLDAVNASEPVTLRQLGDVQLTGIDPYSLVGISSNTYTATGSDTTYNLSAEAPSTDAVIVTLDGVTQTPTTDYSVSGTVVTFTSAPPYGAKIVLRNIGYSLPTTSPPSTVNNFTQTNSESDASVTPTDTSYPPGYIERYGGVADGTTDSTAPFELAATVGRQQIKFYETGRTDVLSTYTGRHRFYILRDAYVDTNSVIGPANFTSDGTQTNAVLHLGRDDDWANGFQYRPRVISDITFSGKLRADNGCYILDDTGNLATTSGPQYTTGWTFNNCAFERCNKGIVKPQGNFYNLFNGCTSSNSNYFMYAEGRNTTSIANMGQDHYLGGHYNGHRKAAFYYDGNQTPDGGASWRNLNIQGNAGFGIFLKDVNGCFEPYIIENVHFENNATAATVDLDDGVGARNPRDIYAENVDALVIRDCWIGQLEVKDSTVTLHDCKLTDGTAPDATLIVNSDADNIGDYRAYNCSLDGWGDNTGDQGGGHVFTIESVKRQNRPLGAFCSHFKAPTRIPSGHKPPNYTAFESSTNERPSDWLEADGTSGDVSPNGKVAGCSFPTATEYTFPANGEWMAPATMTIPEETSGAGLTEGNWLVATLEVKIDAGDSPSQFYLMNEGTQLSRASGMDIAEAKAGEWVTIAIIGEVPAVTGAGACRYRIVTGASTVTVAFGASQLVEFATAQEAFDFYNNRTFCEAKEQTRLVRRTDSAAKNNNTAADDTDLAGWNLQKDTWYKLKGQLLIDTDGTANFRWSWNFSQTPQQFHSKSHTLADGATALGDLDVEFTAGNTNTTAGTTADQIADVDALFKTNATTGGTLALSWSQGTTDTYDTKLQEGSWIEVERLHDDN